ncbi:MAG: toll/interleukin-1 receptor domain-containing protein [Chloroflexota bacterium]
MRKLFISYRSSDHREVDYIAKQLRSIKDENGSAKYTTWQDKHDLNAGKSWWDGIIEAIINCDIFVFHLYEQCA